MKSILRNGRKAAGIFVLLALTPCLAAANSVENFYRDKIISVVVGFNPGGGYDLYARLVTQSWGSYIPGKPRVIVRNMPGAGSRTAGNHLANRSPTDGTELGMISGAVAVGPLIGGVPVKFDSRKFVWIGSPTIDIACACN